LLGPEEGGEKGKNITGPNRTLNRGTETDPPERELDRIGLNAARKWVHSGKKVLASTSKRKSPMTIVNGGKGKCTWQVESAGRG